MVADPPIYHITHVNNLASIIGEDRLWCDAQRIAKGINTTNIGYSHIKERRLRHPVSVAAKGKIGDYVPFNFCPRSVMLYVVGQGHENYKGGQRSVLHLVSSISSAIATGQPWFFTDRHSDLGYAGQFDDLAELVQVDWNVMPLTWWNESEVKEKRQAEFLVHDFCPWNAIDQIGVMDAAMVPVVQQTIAGASHQPAIVVQRGWYY